MIRYPFLSALPFADPLFQSFDAAIAEVATHHRARFADPFPKFYPQGDPNAEISAICTLTLLCTRNESHPSDAGYRTLAGWSWMFPAISAFWNESGDTRCGCDRAGANGSRGVVLKGVNT